MLPTDQSLMVGPTPDYKQSCSHAYTYYYYYYYYVDTVSDTDDDCYVFPSAPTLRSIIQYEVNVGTGSWATLAPLRR